jgi:hypothetical protein
MAQCCGKFFLRAQMRLIKAVAIIALGAVWVFVAVEEWAAHEMDEVAACVDCR